MFYAALRSALAVIGLCAGVSGPGMAVAQSTAFPAERVTIVVPFGAGGPTDSVARVIGQALQEKWRQPVIIDNRPGAGSVIGTEAVVRARPNGYTLLINGDVNSMRVFSKLSFDPLRDLTPVSKLVGQYFVLVTTPGVPVKTLPEFIAYAKQRPKALNYAEIPLTQYQIEYPVLFGKAGIALTAVPYTSAAPITTALLANDVQLFLGSTQLLSPHIASGKLTALATTGQRRTEQLPNVPTVREGGIDYDTSTWFGLYAPTGTPADVVATLAADFAQVLQNPTVVAKLKQMGYEIFAGSPAQMAQELATSARNYDDVVKRLDIKPQ